MRTRILIFLSMGTVAGLLLPVLRKPSSHGGNSAALTACTDIPLVFKVAAENRGKSDISLTEFTPGEIESLRHSANLHRLGEGTILISTNTVSVESTGRQLIAVCTRPFNNVLEKWIGKAPFAYAIGYADGTSELISPAEFARLNLIDFADVRVLAADIESLQSTASASLAQ